MGKRKCAPKEFQERPPEEVGKFRKDLGHGSHDRRVSERDNGQMMVRNNVKSELNNLGVFWYP